MVNPSRGFTKFEFSLVIAMIGVLALAFFARLQSIQEEAERVEVDLVIRNIRVGFQLAIGQHIMQGEEKRIADVAAANPLSFIDPLPRGMRVDAAVPQGPGEWAYDAARRELAYWPRLPGAFNTSGELRWRYEQNSAPDGRVSGIRLSPITRH